MAPTKQVNTEEKVSDLLSSQAPSSRTRIYDPTFLDFDYIHMCSSDTSGDTNPASRIGHLFVYNPHAFVTHPRMVEDSDKARKAAMIATLPAIMVGHEFSNARWHILASTVIVEASLAMLPIETAVGNPAKISDGVKRLHWCVNFGPQGCTLNATGLVPDRISIPGSDQFAELYAIGRAMEKAYEVFSFAKGTTPTRVSLGGGRRKQVVLPKETADCLMTVTEFVVVVGDGHLMRWLGKDLHIMDADGVVEALWSDARKHQKDSLIYRRAVNMVDWVRKLVQRLETEVDVSVMFWGIYDAEKVLLERKHLQRHSPESLRARSPSPEIPSLRSIRMRASPNTPEATFELAKSDDHASVSSSGQSTKSTSSLSQSPFTTPFVSEVDKIHASLVAYILNKYTGDSTMTSDKPWETDDDVRRQQSQIVPPMNLTTKQKRRRDVLTQPTSHAASVQKLESAGHKVMRCIVDVPVGPDGKELERSLIKGGLKRKGPKMRKVVELEMPGSVKNLESRNQTSRLECPVLPLASATPQSKSPTPPPESQASGLESPVIRESPPMEVTCQLQASCPFKMDRDWVTNREETLLSEAERSVSPSPGLAERVAAASAITLLQSASLNNTLLNRVKDANYESSDTIEDLEMTKAQDEKPKRRGGRPKQVKSTPRARAKRPREIVLPRMVTWDPLTTSPVKEA